MPSLQDQTLPEWLGNYVETELGTGIFVIANPDDVDNPYSKIFIEGITLASCKQRGLAAIAFKWVPGRIAPAGQLRSSNCGAPCVYTCTQIGCVCIEGKCI